MSMATTSTSSSALSAEVFSSSPSASWGLCRPGVSTKMSWKSSRVSTARKRCRVVCAVSDVMAIFLPMMALMSVDLPGVRPAHERDEAGLEAFCVRLEIHSVHPYDRHSGQPPGRPFQQGESRRALAEEERPCARAEHHGGHDQGHDGEHEHGARPAVLRPAGQLRGTRATRGPPRLSMAVFTHSAANTRGDAQDHGGPGGPVDAQRRIPAPRPATAMPSMYLHVALRAARRTTMPVAHAHAERAARARSASARTLVGVVAHEAARRSRGAPSCSPSPLACASSFAFPERSTHDRCTPTADVLIAADAASPPHAFATYASRFDHASRISASRFSMTSASSSAIWS